MKQSCLFSRNTACWFLSPCLHYTKCSQGFVCLLNLHFFLIYCCSLHLPVLSMFGSFERLWAGLQKKENGLHLKNKNKVICSLYLQIKLALTKSESCWCALYILHDTCYYRPQHWNYWQVRNISDLVTMWCPAGKSWVVDSFLWHVGNAMLQTKHPPRQQQQQGDGLHTQFKEHSKEPKSPNSWVEHPRPSNKIESCGSSRVSVDQKLCCYLLDTCRSTTSLPGSEQFSQCTFPLLGNYFVANFSKTISTERKAQRARVEGSFGL